MNPTGALRGTTSIHVDDDVMILKDKERQAAKIQDRVETSEMRALASLVNHQGWRIIAKEMADRVAMYQSGQTISTAIASEIGDSDLGRMLRVENLVAAEMLKVITRVELAAEELINQKEEAKDAAQRPVTRGAK